ncbi:Hypothetical protein D9617_32g091520 [Elsinoe fawcettii]|nr:Hypothetical protein D9617_32g091520 [Elsinoe fawcettii]
MDLTPIRIRGARARNGNRHPAIDRSARVRAQGSSATSAPKPTTPVATIAPVIDQLPPEIVELIFSYHPSPNLPLASLSIATKLSNERSFIQCGVFWLLKDITDGEQDTPRTEIEALLQCRWLNWSRFQTILGKVRDAFLDSQGDEPGIIPALVFDKPSQQPSLAFTTLGSSISLPERLLQGPWTMDKSCFLHYLTWLGLGINWEQSTLGETAIRGLEEAIKEKARLAVATLLSDPIAVRPTQQILRSSILQHGCDPTIVFHLLSSAVRAKSRSREDKDWSTDVNPLDASIWSWLRRLDESEPDRAKWLKGALRGASDLMKETSAPEQSHRNLRFICGLVDDGVERIDLPWTT